MSLSRCIGLYYKLPKSDPYAVYQLPNAVYLLQCNDNSLFLWKLTAQQTTRQPLCSFKPPKHDLGRVQSIQKWRRCAICAIQCQKKHENVSRSSNAVRLILHTRAHFCKITGDFLAKIWVLYGQKYGQNSNIQQEIPKFKIEQNKLLAKTSFH